MSGMLQNFSFVALALVLLRAFAAAVLRDVSRQLTATYWGVLLFSQTFGRLWRDPRWRGEWKICWQTDSANFLSENTDIGDLYRCFSIVAVEGAGITPSGSIRYTFVGKLSRDMTILTGTWFDRNDRSGGYQGAFQLRLPASSDTAEGKWIGFSETSLQIKMGALIWEKCRT